MMVKKKFLLIICLFSCIILNDSYNLNDQNNLSIFEELNFFTNNTHPDNLRYLLSTISQSIAAILAIFFSITLLVFQQLSSLYSSNLFRLLFNKPKLIISYCVLSFTILYCLIFITLIENQHNSTILFIIFPVIFTVICFCLLWKNLSFVTKKILDPEFFMKEIKKFLEKSVKNKNKEKCEFEIETLTKIAEVFLDRGKKTEATNAVELIAKIYDKEFNKIIQRDFYYNINSLVDKSLENIYILCLTKQNKDLISIVCQLRIVDAYSIELDYLETQKEYSDVRLKSIIDANNFLLYEAQQLKNDFASFAAIKNFKSIFGLTKYKINEDIFINNCKIFNDLFNMLKSIIDNWGIASKPIIETSLFLAREEWIKWIEDFDIYLPIDRMKLLAIRNDNNSNMKGVFFREENEHTQKLDKCDRILLEKKYKYLFIACVHSISINEFDFIIKLFKKISIGHPKIHSLNKNILIGFFKQNILEILLEETINLEDYESDKYFEFDKRPIKDIIKFYLLARSFSLMLYNKDLIGHFEITDNDEGNRIIYHKIDHLINEYQNLKKWLLEAKNEIFILGQRHILDVIFTGKLEESLQKTIEFFDDRLIEYKSIQNVIIKEADIDPKKIEEYKNSIIKSFIQFRTAEIMLVTEFKKFSDYQTHKDNYRLPLRFLIPKDSFLGLMTVIDFTPRQIGENLAINEEETLLTDILKLRLSTQKSYKYLDILLIDEALKSLLNDDLECSPVIICHSKNIRIIWNSPNYKKIENLRGVLGNYKFTFKNKIIESSVLISRHIPENMTLIYNKNSIGNYITEEAPWIEINEFKNYRYDDYENVDESKLELIVSLAFELKLKKSSNIIRIIHRPFN